MRIRRVFLFELQFLDDSCIGLGYKKNMFTTVVVESSSQYNAVRKFNNAYWGSEYPSFVIISIKEADQLFAPLLIPMDRKSKCELMFYKGAFESCKNNSGCSELTRMEINKLFDYYWKEAGLKKNVFKRRYYHENKKNNG